MIDRRTMMPSLLPVIVGLALPAIALAQATPDAASKGVYSAAQVARGQAAYTQHCASCHGEDLNGADVTPPLSGGKFSGNWKGQTVADLATRIKTTMPLDNPGTLGSATVADLSAFILSKNGYPAGSADLPRDASLQHAMKID